MENNEENEQSIEEAAKLFVRGQYLEVDGIEPGTIAGYRHEGFIAGANHILSSKGLVDREAVVEILKETWCNCKCDNCSTNNLLTDLINKIKEI